MFFQKQNNSKWLNFQCPTNTMRQCGSTKTVLSIEFGFASFCLKLCSEIFQPLILTNSIIVEEMEYITKTIPLLRVRNGNLLAQDCPHGLTVVKCFTCVDSTQWSPVLMWSCISDCVRNFMKKYSYVISIQSDQIKMEFSPHRCMICRAASKVVGCDHFEPCVDFENDLLPTRNLRSKFEHTSF